MKNLIIITFIGFLFIACDRHREHNPASEHETNHAEHFACPMHPNVVQDSPGKCPVCGMDLVKISKHEAGASQSLMLTESQVKLANITTQRVATRPIGQTTILNARIVENADLSTVVSSRVTGRIERLYIKETGRPVRKGEPLFEIYSETLQTLQKEFLLAKEQYETLGSEKRYKSFYEAAKKKLILYGVSDRDVQRLAESKTIQNKVTLFAPVSGVITTLSISEGQYVSEGTQLMRIEELSSIWVEAELYPAERSLVKIGDNVDVKFPGLGYDVHKAKIDFLNPEYRAGTQIVVMRASLSNPHMLFKPGMQAQVILSHSTKNALTLPTDAVIRDGNGTHVYVQRGRNTFTPVMVKTGVEDYDRVEIEDGLHAGDTVAVTGAYLLYSEYILKKGQDPHFGHVH